MLQGMREKLLCHDQLGRLTVQRQEVINSIQIAYHYVTSGWCSTWTSWWASIELNQHRGTVVGLDSRDCAMIPLGMGMGS
jgi:hypothetical protein